MRLIAFGGDERMRGALLAAGRAGWETLHIEDAADVPDEMPPAQAVMLPWPRSFREERLISAKGGLERERVLALIPACRAVLAGGDVKEEELAQTALVVRPEKDETFLRKNARLTAEGALATVMRVKKRALMRETALVTGYGRIGREMTARLCALGMFVIVCARSEEQMRMAHAAGAHPVPLAQIAAACRQADVIINTIPAHVLGDAALAATALPALLGGKSIGALLSIYTAQTGLYTGLTYNAPSFFALMNTTGLDVYAYGNFGMALAFGACALLVACGVKQAGKLTREGYLRLALLLPLAIVFFLPRMHERYFYLADILSAVLAAKNKKAAPICALVALASLGSYWETALPLSFCALMMFAALILTLRHTQREENVI